MVKKLTPSQLSQLEKGLTPLMQPAFKMPTIKEVEEDFCTIWPKAKPILETLAKYVVYVPSVGATAAEIITALEKAGTVLSGAVCPTPTRKQRATKVRK